MPIFNARPFNFFWKRPKGIITDPLPWTSDFVQVHGKVCAHLFRDGESFEVIESKNIVTNAGDLFYAEAAIYGVASGSVPTNFTTAGGVFDGIMGLHSSPTAAPAKTGTYTTATTGGNACTSNPTKSMETGYPKVDDTANIANNTGAATDAITYYGKWEAADANDYTITDVYITNPSPGAAEPILMWAELSPTIAKTSSDTLQMYVNHTFNGV